MEQNFIFICFQVEEWKIKTHDISKSGDAVAAAVIDQYVQNQGSLKKMTFLWINLKSDKILRILQWKIANIRD